MEEKSEYLVSEFEIDETGKQNKRNFTLSIQSDYHLTNSIKQYVNIARRPLGHRKRKMENWQLQFISSILFYESTFASPYQTSLKLVTDDYRTIVWILTHCDGWFHGAIITLDARDLYDHLIYTAFKNRFSFKKISPGEKLSPNCDRFIYDKHLGSETPYLSASFSPDA